MVILLTNCHDNREEIVAIVVPSVVGDCCCLVPSGIIGGCCACNKYGLGILLVLLVVPFNEEEEGSSAVSPFLEVPFTLRRFRSCDS